MIPQKQNDVLTSRDLEVLLAGSSSLQEAPLRPGIPRLYSSLAPEPDVGWGRGEGGGRQDCTQ